MKTNVFDQQEYAVLLSREEFLLIVKLLNGEYLLGLEHDPLLTLTPEQQGIALIVAERALRARDLAKISEDGNLLINEIVLHLAATCAFAEQTMFVSLTKPDDTTEQAFAHRFEDRIVVHSEPDAALHYLQSIQNVEQLVDRTLGFLKLNQLNEVAIAESIILEKLVIETALAAGKTKSAEDISMLLRDNGVESATAIQLANVVAGRPSISTLYIAQLVEKEKVVSYDYIVIATTAAAWLMTATTDQQQFRLQPASTQQLRSLWLEAFDRKISLESEYR
ncbi:hypothetical protein ACP8Y2_08145 [Herpetosiphon llansteffanensis]